jgi:hypothetical protein
VGILSAERISILSILVVHTQVLGYIWVAVRDCFQIHFTSVLFICNLNFLLSHEVFVFSTLLEVVRDGFLTRMHRWMINLWQLRHISSIPPQQLNLGGPNAGSLCLLAASKALSSDFDSFLGTCISIHLDELLLLAIRVGLRASFFLLINEDLSPQGILAHIELLLRLE